jgi:hypothetical protein
VSREKLQGTLDFSQKIQGTGAEQKQTAPEAEKTKYIEIKLFIES